MEKTVVAIKRTQIARRKAWLASVISKKGKALVKAPDGYLRITTNRGNTQYYQVLPGNRKRGTSVYLSKNDLRLAARLAQKTYDKKVLSAAEQELKAWNMLAAFFPEHTVEEVYATLSPARQSLVAPVIETDEEFRAKWEAVTFEPGRIREDAPVFLTDRGERVRSKSEQLIANLLYRLGIPYRYEYPVELEVEGRKKIWRPDFMILDVKQRKEYYLEHFGMLDDTSGDNYARTAFWKMKVYEKNGIYEGKNILYSFETSRAPLDINYVEMKLRRTLAI